MKKIKEILIGTHNKGKIKEIGYLLNKKIKKISPFQLKIKSPAENGKTFKSNSELKAKYFFHKSKIITISDDSGLCIECLDNKPGIYSARWAKKYGGFKQAMSKIIFLVKNKNKNEIKGTISYKILGKNGFGYDPIFIPKGQYLTFGEMGKRKKMSMDHRYLAFKKLKKRVKIL